METNGADKIGLLEMIYLIFSFSRFDGVPPFNTQCLEISAESGEREDLIGNIISFSLIILPLGSLINTALYAKVIKNIALQFLPLKRKLAWLKKTVRLDS